MAEDARRRHSAEVDLLDVSGAYAASRYFNQHFVRLNSRERNGFKAEIVRAAINGSLHGEGNLRDNFHFGNISIC